MEAGRVTGLLVAGPIASVLAVPATTTAGTETIETPVGTYHLVTDGEVQEPRFSGTWEVCISVSFCIIFPVQEPQDPGHVRGQAGVREETNGCPGLQTAPGDCDEDGIEEPADEQVLGVRERI